MIFTLNLTDNFAEKIVDFILSENTSPLQMAQMQIILPTKRAVKTVKECFLKKSEKTPLLLPKLTALYEIDTLEVDIPPAMSHIERLILLTKICQKKPNVETIDQALTIAISLSSLLDEFYQFESSFDDLENLVPDLELAQHWNETIQFLDIIRKIWPTLLAEKGLIDEQDRKIRLINAFTNKIKKNPPTHKIIIAGFDGALPAVSRLIKEINNLPNSLILLQGLNTWMTDEDLKYVDENHYQHSFKQLLKTLNLFPPEIKNLSQDLHPREELIIEALRPAEQAEEWRYLNLSPDVLKNVKRIDCESINEEALAIALILRETLETPEKTAALVTNDRMLARRVILEMKRWGVELDDSAGTPLHHTPVGVYLSLIALLGKEYPNNQSNLLSLLKHPLSADQMMPTDLRKLVKVKEKEAREKQNPLDIELNTNLDVFLSFFKENTPAPFIDILEAHLKVAEELATSPDRSGQERLWGNEAGQEAYKLFVKIKEHGHKFDEIQPADYFNMIMLFLSGLSVRSRYGMHNRLDILGPIEARLTHPDVCIISGLNEGSFPMLSDTGPWLSRQMRKALKLPAIESKIASQSMDFAHCFSSPEVYLTRSVKSDGSQTIPSRFLSRIDAVLNASNIEWKIEPPHYARLLDKTTLQEQIVRPVPTPPVSVRPKELSVTNVELLMKNPYAIYAKYILKLFPLKDIGDTQETITYGLALHNTLETFMKTTPFHKDSKQLKEQIINTLKEYHFPEASLAFYDEKITKISNFIIKNQSTREELTDEIFVEEKGSLQIELEDNSIFTLTGKADRIDKLKSNTLEVIDYKTGTPPSGGEIISGLSPQMTLEAVLLRENGFEKIKPTNDIKISYWRLNGKNEGGEIIPIPSKTAKKDVSDLIEEAHIGLKNILNKFRDEKTPYTASPRPDKIKFNDYALLSREKEWLTADDSDDEE